MAYCPLCEQDMQHEGGRNVSVSAVQAIYLCENTACEVTTVKAVLEE